MQTFFLICALVGTATLLLQLVGAGLHEVDVHTDVHADLLANAHDGHDGHEAISHGLHLFSTRALAAGLAFFGTTGWFALRAGWLAMLAIPAALLTGVAATVIVASVLRAMNRLESDGTLQVTNAIGQEGTVYLAVPGDDRGMGKVHVTVQGRLAEFPAVTSGPALSTGSAVIVIDIRDNDVLEVRTATSILQDEV
jgi:membrane protein implicated in regulation of membrane protease activity